MTKEKDNKVHITYRVEQVILDEIKQISVDLEKNFSEQGIGIVKIPRSSVIEQLLEYALERKHEIFGVAPRRKSGG